MFLVAAAWAFVALVALLRVVVVVVGMGVLAFLFLGLGLVSLGDWFWKGLLAF